MADQEKSARDIEMEQEAKLMAKYGGLKPKTKLLPKDKKYFDSAEWAMNKEAAGKKGPAGPGGPAGPNATPGAPAPSPGAEETPLPPKLEPSEKVASRRISHLDGSPTEGPKS